MNFSPCLVVPVYNHPDTVAATVAKLAAYEVTIYLVDDGSASATQTALHAAAANCPLVRLIRLEQNQGKGAAVMRGMREAYAAGHTHALQIDVDGQHDAADVALFFARGRLNPEAVVCGRPIFDASVPKARLYGRYITHFWVWVETLSFDIGDSMCGFRLYPLTATCALIDAVTIPHRMNFDSEIVVRLYWRGLPVENIPTRVTYPADSISHFDMLRDNLRITATHTRLTFGMLLRLPLLLARRFRRATGSSTHWSKLRELGTRLGIQSVFICYRVLGDRMARLMLYPIVTYYFVTRARAREASRAYLQQLAEFSAGRPPTWRDSYRHMYAFAESGLDKFIAWIGCFDPARAEFPERAEFERLIARGKGAVIVGSHLGNLEMTRALAVGGHAATVNAVIYTDHAIRFNGLLQQANADFGVNLIQVSAFGPDTAIQLRDKIDRGELLVIVGDRTPPAESGRICYADFLGRPAPFAQGPFILASLLECPVYLFFCLRDGGRYRVYLEHFAEQIELPRQERAARLQDYVQRYAQRLESYCVKAPEQWFNFYDFWRVEAQGKT
jgi:predicted LPLAT superfamily acyltransferase